MVVSVCFVRPGGVVGAWGLRLPVVVVVVAAVGCEVGVDEVADIVVGSVVAWVLVAVVPAGATGCWFCWPVIAAGSVVSAVPGNGSSADGGIGAPDSAAPSSTA